MGVMTLLRFLVGDSDAILRIAGDRNALWIGFVFVLSAGFAREYDGQDLLREPWHLLLPLAASLAAATVLYLIIHVTSYGTESVAWPSVLAYLSFLGLFWMTAPLAWLYAVPYERFMSKESAINANLATLGVVALWRVVLMVRVAVVCTGLPVRGAIGAVMLLGSVGVAMVFALGYGVLVLMGGLRGVTVEPDVRYLSFAVFWPVVGVAVVAWLFLRAYRKPEQGGWLAPLLSGPAPPTRPLALLVASSLLVWVFILPLTQPEQQRRRAFEDAMKARDYDTAAELLARYGREGFPPHWMPSPEEGVSEDFARLGVGMMLALDEHGGPAWAREYYFRDVMIGLAGCAWSEVDGWSGLDEELLEFLADALPRLREGATLLAETRKRKPPSEPQAGPKSEPDHNDSEYWREVNLRAVLAIIDRKKGK
jgi:hypothetical protein